MANLPPNTSLCPRPRRRWAVRLSVAAGILLALYLLRAPLLTGLASVLIVDEPGFSADHLLLLSGDRMIRRAVEIHGREASRLLLIHWAPDRLQLYGLVPSRLTVQRRELEDADVPTSAVAVLPEIVRSDWDVARQVKEWLAQHPDARVRVLCHRFDSRRVRHVFAGILGGELGRVGFEALPDRGFDETDWWRHKEGLLDFLQSSLHLGYTQIAGEEGLEEDWDPDEYERALKG